MIRFRNARQKDFAQIRRIALKGWLSTYTHIPNKKLRYLVTKYYSEKNLERSLKNATAGKELFLVAELNKKIIGFCHVIIRKMKGELVSIYMDLSHAGKGIGTELLSKCEVFLKRNGYKKYFTFVNKHNKKGLNFYLKNGFIRVK